MNITATRVQKIMDTINSEPLLKEKVSKEKVEVPSRDGKTHSFPKEIVALTEEIHKRGKDAYTILKKEVLQIAKEVWGIDGAAALTSEAAAPNLPKGKKGTIDHNIAITSLLISAKQLSDFDKSDGAATRKKELDKLLGEYSAAAGIAI